MANSTDENRQTTCLHRLRLKSMSVEHRPLFSLAPTARSRVARRFDTPIGELVAIATGDSRLLALEFADRRSDDEIVGRWKGEADVVWDTDSCEESVLQVEQYFRRERTSFDLPMAPQGTPFELAVWNALREIPYGSTATYGEIAARLGSPGGPRSVGRANARNPIPVIIPCHRVIGADGTLVGYGGGLDRKRFLLEHEGALPLELPL